ncbi:YkgJ family cysteine cluster protein [Micromonospora sp. STR1s_5]|nr:YkgJ family cysteine cluster protein [Micromonospora sp. STR1s_5]
MTDHQLDCRCCGACCQHGGEVPVYVTDSTPRHLTRPVRGRIGFDADDEAEGVRCMAKRPGGQCKALQGTVGVSVSCGIYALRPAICREFPPGSDGCRYARGQMRRAISGRTSALPSPDHRR